MAEADGGVTGLAIVALDAFLTLVGEDDAGLLAAVDLRLAGELAADQVDWAVRRYKRVGQAEDIDEDGAVELGAGRVFVDLVEGQEELAAEQVELALGLGVLGVGEGAGVEGWDVGDRRSQSSCRGRLGFCC